MHSDPFLSSRQNFKTSKFCLSGIERLPYKCLLVTTFCEKENIVMSYFRIPKVQEHKIYPEELKERHKL